MDGRAVFYFDLGSPYAYLAAERLAEALPVPARWQPILLGGLFKANGRNSWALRDPTTREAGIAEVERRARERGLPPLRWPDPYPGNTLIAMRAATHAQRRGREVEFAMAGFRTAFTQGLDVTELDVVLSAAERAGIDPEEVRDAVNDPEVKAALRVATEDAHARGVIGVPTLAVGERLFWGDDRLDEATAALGTTG